MDAYTGDGDNGQRVKALREELGKEHGVGFFKTPDELANKVNTAVTLELRKPKEKPQDKEPTGIPSYVKQAIDALTSVDPDGRKEAIETLGQIDHPAAQEALIGALQLPFRDVRIRAAIVLSQSKDERAVPVLIEALHRKHDEVRWNAMQSLELIGKPAVPGLIDILRDDKWEGRQAAAVVLGRIGDAAAVDDLLDMLRDKNTNVRGEVIRALEQIGDSRAVPHLIGQLLNTETPTVGYSVGTGSRICDLAAEALERIGTPEALAAFEKWYREQGSGRAITE